MSVQLAYTGLTIMMKLIGVLNQTNVENSSMNTLQTRRQRWRISPNNILSYTNHICNFSRQTHKDILYFIGGGYNKCCFSRMDERAILIKTVQHENNFGKPLYFDPLIRSTLFYNSASQFMLDLDYIVTASKMY